mmetsp:Transcript_73587/g.225079  ORF Transcript_73587/g.225079 Transcript_73587/m.225079 type:complete len:313 (+) Transcript_73587:450-1388(+)
MGPGALAVHGRGGGCAGLCAPVEDIHHLLSGFTRLSVQVLDIYGAILLHPHIQLGLALPRCALGQQVDQVVPVQLHHRALDRIDVPGLVVLAQRVQLVDRPRRHAQLSGLARHGERLAGASLAIGEERDIIAIHRGLDQVLAVLENLVLAPRRKHSVELEVRIVLPNDQRHGVGLPGDVAVSGLLLLGAQRPDAAEHADGSFEVLDRVMELFPPNLGVVDVNLGHARCKRRGDRAGQALLGGADRIDVLHVRGLALLDGLPDLRQAAPPLLERLALLLGVLVLRRGQFDLLRRVDRGCQGLDRGRVGGHQLP